jgi:hypothetical protein
MGFPWRHCLKRRTSATRSSRYGRRRRCGSTQSTTSISTNSCPISRGASGDVEPLRRQAPTTEEEHGRTDHILAKVRHRERMSRHLHSVGDRGGHCQPSFKQLMLEFQIVVLCKIYLRINENRVLLFCGIFIGGASVGRRSLFGENVCRCPL